MSQSRIDHIVIAVRPENFESMREQMERVIGARFEYAEREDLGVNIYTDWGSGIEILAPTSADSPVWQHIDANGQGVMSIVFNVENLDSAKKRAGDAGLMCFPEIGLRGDEPWADRFETMRETPLQPIFGVALVLAEARLKD